MKINNLEEIAVGKKIKDETIVSNEKRIIKTISQIKFPTEARSWLTTYILSSDNTLQYLSNKDINEADYNKYLNSIKQKPTKFSDLPPHLK